MPLPRSFVTLIRAAGRAKTRAARQALAREWLGRQAALPLIEDGQALVVCWSRARQAPLLRNDMEDLRPGTMRMTRLRDTDLWYAALRPEPDARIDYHFQIAGHRRLDPRNPHQVPGGYGERSEFRMPGYVTPPELLVTQPPAWGHIETVWYWSEILAQQRRFWVYTPAGYDPQGAYPSVTLNDGRDYLDFGRFQCTVDTLTGTGRLRPVVGILVEPVVREREYDCDDAYTRFLCDEVMPWVRARYALASGPERHAIGGVSYGGLSALYTALERPDTYGRVLGQSSYFSRGKGAFLASVVRRPRLPVRTHLSVGTYDDFLRSNRRMAALFARRGATFAYGELHEGHSWGLWRAQLGAALRYLFD